MLQQLKRAIAPRAVIREIHREFDTAAEKLVQEAREITSRPNGLSMANRLRSLGFDKAEGVTLAADEQRVINQAALAEKYAFKYPQYKFITTEQVEQICKKYDLVCGQADNYKGAIPEKNVSQMEAFKIDEADTEVNFFDRMRITFDIARFMPTFGFEGERRELIDAPSVKAPSFKFKICAPEKDFDRSQTKRVGFFLVPKDPIVLCQVKGGFLIVTKWGLEASDEIVRNEIDN